MSTGPDVTVVPLLAASNASCWFSYSLFVASGKLVLPSASLNNELWLLGHKNIIVVLA